MPNKKPKKKVNIPVELEGVASTSDVDALEDKVAKCYSAERYEDFQEAVKNIALETIGSDTGRTKIKAHAKESAAEYSAEQGWTKKTFWWPFLISVLVAIVAIVAVIIDATKHP
jgi:vacuolar-type H+-ATPase subunit E/Vma4